MSKGKIELTVSIILSNTPPTTPTQSIREKESSKKTHVQKLKDSQELENPDKREYFQKGHRRNNSNSSYEENFNPYLKKSISQVDLLESQENQSMCPKTPTFGIG